ANRIELYESKLRPQAVTDSDGRFAFADMPREHCIDLNVTHPRFAFQWFNCPTIDEREVKPANAIMSQQEFVRDNPQWKFVPNGFTARLHKGRMLSGKVTFAESGKPASGV